ncbi:hypothetical protein U8335_09415 [Roseiconus lacunae]|uniref:hypothetical protein n=1 Tax=Roseiconus lacunae TaxID=2605694 RepID=UPI003085B9E3|nr:hypothetical protein U8335_09415 [Stieleria sp. HD01]
MSGLIKSLCLYCSVVDTLLLPARRTTWGGQRDHRPVIGEVDVRLSGTDRVLGDRSTVKDDPDHSSEAAAAISLPATSE